MARNINVRLPDELHEHLECLADRLSRAAGKDVTVSGIVRAALKDVQDGNPIEPDEMARFRKSRSPSGRGVQLKRSANGALKALAIADVFVSTVANTSVRRERDSNPSLRLVDPNPRPPRRHRRNDVTSSSTSSVS